MIGAIHSQSFEIRTQCSGLFFDRRSAQARGPPDGSSSARVRADGTTTGKERTMKKLSVVIAGSGQIRDLDIQPGTTAGDVLAQLNLSDYLLSKGPDSPFFAAAESVYDKVKDGEKIF